MNDNQQSVVLFDGFCNLCNSSVDLIIRNDKKNQFKFASLQGEFGREVISRHPDLKGIDSVVLYTGDSVYTEMEAAIRIGRELRFPLNLVVIMRILPKGIQNAIYRWISRNRYKWFGKKETCRVPTSQERTLFID